MAANRFSVRRGILRTPLALLFVVLISLGLVVPVSAAPAAKSAVTKPVYTFTVELAVAQATADRAGGYVSALSKALTQFDHINRL